MLFLWMLLQCLGLQNLSEDEVLKHAQTHWYQPKERWNFEPNLEEKRSELAPIFEKMGFIAERKPLNDHYNYALIVGATLWRVEERLHYLENCGAQVDHIVFLTGMRPLLEEEKKNLPSGIETESEMISYLGSFLNVPYTIVNAPMIADKRPGLIETLDCWLETEPAAGTYLAISNQPFLPYHQAILDRRIEAETVGPQATESWSVALLLDTIARTLYISGLCPMQHFK